MTRHGGAASFTCAPGAEFAMMTVNAAALTMNVTDLTADDLRGIAAAAMQIADEMDRREQGYEPEV